MSEKQIAAWWDGVKDELCWSGAIIGVTWNELVEDWTPEVVESVRGVYRKAVLSTASALKIKFGCYCDLDPGKKPDACVLDNGDYEDCIYAKKGMKKETCAYWREIKP